MSRFFYHGNANKNNDSGSGSIAAGKVVRLGTKKAPAQVSVQNEQRKQEIEIIMKENGWFADIKVDEKADEDIRDLEILQSKTERAVTTKKANRNDPCPCGSGKKYKKCCGG